MNFQPLGKRVLVERLEDVKTTASGIIIPDNAKEKPLSGKVLAVSSEAEGVNVGDSVVFTKYGGTEVVLDGKTYLVLKIEDVLGVLK